LFLTALVRVVMWEINLGFDCKYTSDAVKAGKYTE